MDLLDAIAMLNRSFPSSSFTGVVIPGAPPTKARPRFGRGRTYMTGQQKSLEEWTRKHLRTAFSQPLEGNIAIGCVFYRPTRQRIDVDNLTKHVFDAANGVCWNDDSQVTAVVSVLELDRENPRTIVVVGDHTSTMNRGALASVCARCGETFVYSDGSSKVAPKYCSKKCRSFLATTSCAECGVEFKRESAAQRFCSKSCGAVSRQRVERRTRTTPRCVDCGDAVSKPGYARCRSCWRTARKAGTS